MDFRQFLERFDAYSIKDIEELIPSTYQDPMTLQIMGDMFEEMGDSEIAMAVRTGNPTLYGRVTWPLMDEAFPRRLKSGASGTGTYARTPQGTRDAVTIYWKEIPVSLENPGQFVPYVINQELHYTPQRGYSYEIKPDNLPRPSSEIKAPSNENTDRAIRAIEGARATWNRNTEQQFQLELPEPEKGPLRVLLVLMRIPSGMPQD
jgi:hypothetical protein